jgi:hypothetical protein
LGFLGVFARVEAVEVIVQEEVVVFLAGGMLVALTVFVVPEYMLVVLVGEGVVGDNAVVGIENVEGLPDVAYFDLLEGCR